MEALKRFLLVCCGAAMLTVAAPAGELQADDDDYWRSYWSWHDRSYRPYYQHRFAPYRYEVRHRDWDDDDWEDAREDWEDRMEDRREDWEDWEKERRKRWERRGYRGGPVYDPYGYVDPYGYGYAPPHGYVAPYGYAYPYGRPYYGGTALRVGPLWFNWR